MKRILTTALMIAGLTGCPPQEIPIRRIVDVNIMVTCAEPGDPCNADISVNGDENVVRDILVSTNTTRPGQDPVANDDLAIDFASAQDVTGFVTSESNDVVKQSQDFGAVLNAGSSSILVSYTRHMQIEFDNNGQYEVNLEFFAAPASKYSAWIGLLRP